MLEALFTTMYVLSVWDDTVVWTVTLKLRRN